MSQRHPAWTPIFEMEDDVRDVARFGELLRTLGATTNMIDPCALWVLGAPLRDLGERLEARWGAAFEALKGGQA